MINKTIIKIFLCFSIAFFPLEVGATVVEVPFGGMHTLTYGSLVCDCGGNSNFILDYATMSVVVLYRAPTSIFYSYFNNYGLYQLGSWRPVASMECLIYYGYGCTVLQYNYGDYGMMPGTGTTLY